MRVINYNDTIWDGSGRDPETWPRKWLRITVHDNDYTGFGKILGEAIQEMIFWRGEQIREDNVEEYREAIAELWTAFQKFDNVGLQLDNDVDAEFFKANMDMKIVGDGNIEADNYESIYISMFKYAEVVVL